MAICQVSINPNGHQYEVFPVSGAGSNIPVGTLMMGGATAGTNEGVAIPYAATSPGATGTADGIGVLADLHNFSASGDATQATLVSWFPNGVLGSGNTQFPSRKIELFDTAVQINIDYSLASTVAVASSTSTVITITSEVAGLGGGFMYFNAGTAIGSVAFLVSSTSGSASAVSAMATTPDSTTKITKILPHFYNLPIWLVNTTTVPTQLDSVAGNGSGRGVILGAYAQRNNIEERMDPKVYHKLTGLNSLTTLRFYARLMPQDTIFHPID